MPIENCEVFLVGLPQRRDHSWASKTSGTIGRHAIVRMEAADATVGWGEAPAIPTWGGHGMRQYGETPETVAHVVTELLAPVAIGSDPLAIGPLHTRMDAVVKGHPYAKAAVDVACHDIAARQLGVSVADLLGGPRRPGIEICHSLGLLEIDLCLEEAEKAVAEGVRTIKCKTGVDGDRDVALVAALRDRLGPNIAIRVDGNEGYRSVSEAVSVTKRQEEFGLLLCEQPLGGAKALAEVARRIDVPVMADESAWTAEDILELAALGAAESFSCYVTKPGGLWRARQQAEIGATVGMTCDIGGSIETGIGNAANLQLGVSLESAVIPSVCPVNVPRDAAGPEIAGVYYTDDLIATAFELVEGVVRRPPGPGLGIEVDEDKVRHYSLVAAGA